MNVMSTMKIPTYIISGFLGCGKTELLNQFVSQNKEKKIVIIENEVAEFGIDGKVSQSENVKVIEINDGCISSVNLRALEKVISYSLDHFNIDLILIEASGAASLDPIISVLAKFNKMVVYGITVVDAERFSKAKKLSSHTLEHISKASLVVLNKCDLITYDERQRQLKNVLMLNKNVVESVRCNIALAKVLEKARPIFSEEGKIYVPSSYMMWKIKSNFGILSEKEKHANINAYVYEAYGIVSLEKLKRFFLVNNFPRAKGFIYLRDGKYGNNKKLYYFNVISDRFTLEEAPEQGLDKEELNRIVLIGDNVYSKRHIFRSKLSKCIHKTLVNNLQNLFWILKNQQKIPERVVYL